MNNDRSKIEKMEETPVLRSIKIGSQSEPLPPVSRAFTRQTKFRQIQLASNGGAKQPLISVSCGAWTVDELLPSIPVAYILERSNVYVNNSTAQKVADRISDTLRAHSIATRASETAKNSLQAESSRGLRFRVTLFASDDNSDTVIVEVQRLRGCSVEFRQLCRNVCRSAKGLSNNGLKKRKFAIPSCIPRASMAEKENRYRGGVEAAMKMIQSDRVDSQLLGLESMEILSSNECEISSLFPGECVARLMAFSKSSSDFQGYHGCLRRRLALTILANGLVACKRIPVELSSESFVKQLRDCLSLANEEPHECYQASRCLQSLETSKDSTTALLPDDLNTRTA